VLQDSGKRVGGRVVWVCQCECGAIVEATTRALTSGIRRSCGCR
jgi:hypothetical protein